MRPASILGLVALLVAVDATALSLGTPQFSLKWGSQGYGDGQFQAPYAIAVGPSGNVYVADTVRNQIQKFTPDGTFLLKWGSAGRGQGSFQQPAGIAVGPDESIYVADRSNRRIQKFSSEGAYVGEWGVVVVENGQSGYVSGVAVDPTGVVYVTDDFAHNVQKFTSDGLYLNQWGSGGSPSGFGYFSGPNGVAVDGAGLIYVVDAVTDYPDNLQKYRPDGTILLRWTLNATGPPENATSIAAKQDGTIFVGVSGGSRVEAYDSNGGHLGSFGSPGTGDGQFGTGQLAVAVGPDGSVYVADSQNRRIQKFSMTTPILATTWSSIKTSSLRGH